ncbi:hypothetical protein PMAC_000800 [Pneumocystis sp. 'macacae']|nr:hypothetical protein PMAC_000800 [Pneumocystis sp. 'macacae']
MWEVSLFAGISAHKKEKVMHALERLTGQKQYAFVEWHMVYVPPSDTKLTSDRPDLYLRLCAQLSETDAVSIASAIASASASIATCSLVTERYWTVTLVDAPEVGVKRSATSRLRLQSRVLRGNIFALLEELGYTFRFAYGLHGIRYIYGYCVLTLAQPLHQQTVSTAFPSSLVSVDQTNSWLLEATVNVENASDRALMDEAVEELSRLRKILQGVCHLEPADDHRLLGFNISVNLIELTIEYVKLMVECARL